MVTSRDAGPSGAWFILPSVMLIAGGVLAIMGFASFVNFVRSDYVVYQPGSSISVTQDGFTLYAEGSAAGTSDLRCTAIRPEGQIRLRPVRGRVTLSNDRGTFVAIASTPKDLPAGRYALSCQSASVGPDGPLYLGPRIDLAAMGRLALFSIIAPLFLGLCTVVLFSILVYLRYRPRGVTAAGL